MHASFQFSNCWHFIHCLQLDWTWSSVRTYHHRKLSIPCSAHNGNHDLYNYCGISVSALVHVCMPLYVLAYSILFECGMMLIFDFVIWCKYKIDIRMHISIWKNNSLGRLFGAWFCVIVNYLFNVKINMYCIRTDFYFILLDFIHDAFNYFKSPNETNMKQCKKKCERDRNTTEEKNNSDTKH